MSMLLKNGRIVHHDGIRQEDILISGETIKDVGTNLISEANAEIIDCSGKLIFPGLIDPHTHMGIPIKDGWSADDFKSGSLAALNGGVTTIIDFSILEPGQSLADSITKRQQNATESHCDYHLHGNITRFEESILEEIPALFDMGISSFKVFTTYKEAGMMLNYDEIGRVADVLAEQGGLLMVHAEDDEVVTAATKPLAEEGHTGACFHSLSRPAESEAEAIRQIAKITEKSGCPTYIVHLSSAAGLNAAAAYPELFLETCPQYLLLDERKYQDEDGRMYVASPPLHKQADNQALWDGITNGQILTLGTDHCPFKLGDKNTEIPFQSIPNGMGGVETLFPVMLAEFIRRGLELPLLTSILSTNSARLFELFPRKGSVAPGSDADITIVNPKQISTDWQDRLVSNSDWNAFQGFPAVFPEYVFRRGEQVLEKSRLKNPGQGKFIRAKRLIIKNN